MSTTNVAVSGIGNYTQVANTEANTGIGMPVFPFGQAMPSINMFQNVADMFVPGRHHGGGHHNPLNPWYTNVSYGSSGGFRYDDSVRYSSITGPCGRNSQSYARDTHMAAWFNNWFNMNAGGYRFA